MYPYFVSIFFISVLTNLDKIWSLNYNTRNEKYPTSVLNLVVTTYV